MFRNCKQSHASATGGEFCGIDLKQEDGKKRIKAALEQLLLQCYDFAKKDGRQSADLGANPPEKAADGFGKR